MILKLQVPKYIYQNRVKQRKLNRIRKKLKSFYKVKFRIKVFKKVRMNNNQYKIIKSHKITVRLNPQNNKYSCKITVTSQKNQILINNKRKKK